MERICCIIDMDGFQFPLSRLSASKFYVRELAYVRVSREGTFLPRSYRFDLRGLFDLNNLEQKSILRLQHQTKLTGLSILPLDGEPVMNYDLCNDLMNSIYRRCKTENMDRVAFKGGIIEKTFLKDLGIPSLNLESYGCPSYEELLDTNPWSSTRNCGFHQNTTRPVIHCPLAEVAAFRDWLQRNCRYSHSQNDGDSETSEDTSDSEDE